MSKVEFYACREVGPEDAFPTEPIVSTAARVRGMVEDDLLARGVWPRYQGVHDKPRHGEHRGPTLWWKLEKHP